MSQCTKGVQGIRGSTGQAGKDGVNSLDIEQISQGVSFISERSTGNGREGVMCLPFKDIQPGRDITFTGDYDLNTSEGSSVQCVGNVTINVLPSQSPSNVSIRRASVSIQEPTLTNVSIDQSNVTLNSESRSVITVKSSIADIEARTNWIIPECDKIMLQITGDGRALPDGNGILMNDSHVSSGSSIRLRDTSPAHEFIINDTSMESSGEISCYCSGSILFRSVMLGDVDIITRGRTDMICPRAQSGPINSINSGGVLRVSGIASSSGLVGIMPTLSRNYGLYINESSPQVYLPTITDVNREYCIYSQIQLTLNTTSFTFLRGGVQSSTLIVQANELIRLYVSIEDRIYYIL
uniref:Uncharacterized protein n=1 Tax=viral metagenome TaxID=1070528 RepID=A0A6C0BL60_9ZZZZ